MKSTIHESKRRAVKSVWRPGARGANGANCGLIFLALVSVAGLWTAPTWSQESRTWTDASGQASVEATLKELKRESVVLLLADGTKKTVPLAQLSEVDREYLAEIRRARLAENAAKKKAATAAEQRGADLQDEFQATLADFAEREKQLKSAETDAAALRIARQGLVQETSQALLELVRSEPQAEVARDVYLWVLRNGGTSETGASSASLLVEHFSESPELIAVLGQIASQLPLLEQLQKKTKNPDIKGIASFLLARQLANRNNPADEDRTVALLKEVISKHAEVIDATRKPLGPQAERLLFVTQHLSIGKVAPDINGVDLDGVSFKLSDYRGRVVVLDFWGDW